MMLELPSVYDQAKEWRSWPDDDELLSVACSSLFYFFAPRTLLLTLMFQWPDD